MRQEETVEPDRVNVINSLAWVKATSSDDKLRDIAEALRLVRKAAELTDHKQPEILDTYAAALAANGRFSEAVQACKKALVFVGTLYDKGKELGEQIKARIRLYQAHRPYIETSTE